MPYPTTLYVVRVARCVLGVADVLPRSSVVQATREGAALGVPVTTAYRALVHKARAAPNEWVLVHGASGAVGLAAVQMAVAWGMKVIATAGGCRRAG